MKYYDKSSVTFLITLTRLGTKPRSNRPTLGPKSRLMGMSRRDGTGLGRWGWSRLMMLLARASVASVGPPPRGRRFGSPPPGPAPCHGDTPTRPKFFPLSLRPKSLRRPLFCGLRFAISTWGLNELVLAPDKRYVYMK